MWGKGKVGGKGKVVRGRKEKRIEGKVKRGRTILERYVRG